MFTTIDKALVAGLGAIIYFLGEFGIGLPFEASEALLQSLAAVLTPILVWAIPNKPQE